LGKVSYRPKIILEAGAKAQTTIKIEGTGERLGSIEQWNKAFSDQEVAEFYPLFSRGIHPRRVVTTSM
jgi:hypothetical protein